MRDDDAQPAVGAEHEEFLDNRFYHLHPTWGVPDGDRNTSEGWGGGARNRSGDSTGI